MRWASLSVAGRSLWRRDRRHRAGARAGTEEATMHAQVGDWLLVGNDRGRIGLVIGVPVKDGSPPYIIKWLSDGHIAMVFPDQSSCGVPPGWPECPCRVQEDGYLARISLSRAAKRSDSSCSRCQMLRPNINPVAPASMDSRAFSGMASSPARSPPETSSRVRFADLTTASMACRAVRHSPSRTSPRDRSGYGFTPTPGNA